MTSKRYASLAARNKSIVNDFNSRMDCNEIAAKHGTTLSVVCGVVDKYRAEAMARRELDRERKAQVSLSVNDAVRKLEAAGHSVTPVKQQVGAFWLDGKVVNGADLVKFANKDNPKFKDAIHA